MGVVPIVESSMPCVLLVATGVGAVPIVAAVLIADRVRLATGSIT